MGKIARNSLTRLSCLTLLSLVGACSNIPGPDRSLVSDDSSFPAPVFAPAPTAAAPTPAPAPAPAPVKKKPSVDAKPASATATAVPTPAPVIIVQTKKEPPAPVALEPLADTIEIPSLQLPPAIDLTAAPNDLWQRIRNGFAMPDLDNPLVINRQTWYANQPEYIKRMVERSRRYMYHIVEEIEKRGMPMEIALLPMVESAFNPMAYSRARASGLWQFIPSTGKRYDLQQNWWYDSRRDILASTSAALDYLQSLYDRYGDWQLALASYNWGENGVGRAIERNRAKGLPTDYSNLKMPNETRYYIPKLQALKNIIANPAAFGVDLDPIPNQPYFVTVPKTQDIDIRLAAKLADMPVDDLIALNPAYNRPVISGTQTLVLPADRVELFQSNLEKHDQPLVSWKTYVMKSSDKLERLAAQHGISLERLKTVNGITTRNKAHAGQTLLLPIKGTTAAVEPLPAVFRAPNHPSPRTRHVVYVAKKGDTLFSIAQRFRTSVENIQRWNKIEQLMAGQRLVIHARASGQSRTKKSAKARATASNHAAPKSIVQTSSSPALK